MLFLVKGAGGESKNNYTGGNWPPSDPPFSGAPDILSQSCERCYFLKQNQTMVLNHLVKDVFTVVLKLVL